MDMAFHGKEFLVQGRGNPGEGGSPPPLFLCSQTVSSLLRPSARSSFGCGPLRLELIVALDSCASRIGGTSLIQSWKLPQANLVLVRAHKQPYFLLTSLVKYSITCIVGMLIKPCDMFLVIKREFLKNTTRKLANSTEITSTLFFGVLCMAVWGLIHNLPVFPEKLRPFSTNNRFSYNP